MKFVPLAIEEILCIELDRIEDERGFFARNFCADEFRERGLFSQIRQINTSFTLHRGTIRGFTFSARRRRKRKWCVFYVDQFSTSLSNLRNGSKTYGRWVSRELSEENRFALYIPEGFAHGFQTLTNEVEMTYLHSVAYDAASSGGVYYDDAQIGIDWPLPETVISPRDRELPSFSELEPLKS